MNSSLNGFSVDGTGTTISGSLPFTCSYHAVVTAKVSEIGLMNLLGSYFNKQHMMVNLQPKQI